MKKVLGYQFQMKLLQASEDNKSPKIHEVGSFANKISPLKQLSDLQSKMSLKKSSSPKTNSEFLDEFQLQHVDLTQFEKKQGVSFPSLRQKEIQQKTRHGKSGSQTSELLGLRT